MKTPGVELYEVLIAAAESRNLTEAATKLKISQPAVSVKLKTLEKLAPLPLFRYEGKRKVLTHYGRELFQIAKANQLRMYESFEELNRNYAAAETLTLRVGARKELFERLAHKFRFPGRIEFVAVNSRESVALLLQHKVDIAISYEPHLPNSAEIIAKKVLESVSEFVVHKKLLPKKFGEQLIRDKEYLLNTPCVIYEGGGHSLRYWVDHLGIQFEQLRVSAVAEDWRIVKSLIEEGWGYGIVPAHIKSMSKDLFVIPMPTAVMPKFTFYALFQRDLKKIPAFKDLLEFKDK